MKGDFAKAYEAGRQAYRKQGVRWTDQCLHFPHYGSCSSDDLERLAPLVPGHPVVPGIGGSMSL